MQLLHLLAKCTEYPTMQLFDQPEKLDEKCKMAAFNARNMMRSSEKNVSNYCLKHHILQNTIKTYGRQFPVTTVQYAVS